VLFAIVDAIDIFMPAFGLITLILPPAAAAFHAAIFSLFIAISFSLRRRFAFQPPLPFSLFADLQLLYDIFDITLFIFAFAADYAAIFRYSLTLLRHAISASIDTPAAYAAAMLDC